MEVADMTKTAKERLKKIGRCSLCGEPIQSFEDVQIIKYRSGKYIEYHFFHTSCLKKSRESIQWA